MSKQSHQESIKDEFNQRARTYGHTARAVGWYSRETQIMRYDQLLKHLPSESFTLLDVGCGQGDLFHYLLEQSYSATYTGIDVSPEQINLAKTAYPSGTFLEQDCQSFHQTPFDIVVACGAFNLLTDNHSEYFLTQVKALLRLSQSKVIISTLLKGKESQYYHPGLYAYYSCEDYQQLLSGLNADIHIEQDYLPNDCLICLTKRA